MLAGPRKSGRGEFVHPKHPVISFGRRQIDHVAAVDHPERFDHIFERGWIRRVLECLDVFAQRRRIGVAFVAAVDLAQIGFLGGVGARVLEAIGRVRVGLRASVDGADVRLLARMRTSVNLEVFRTREGLVALLASMGLLFGVGAHVDEHFVACVEATVGPGTRVPLAVVEAGWAGDGVRVRDVGGQLQQVVEGPAYGRETIKYY